MTASQRLIVALDTTDLEPALRLARRLRGVVRTVKVGSVLFTAHGPEAVRRLTALGVNVMLDLKWCDIPSTVERSCRAAADLGVWALTVHAAGGDAMLKAAARGARAGRRRPAVLGVTVLTSDPSTHPAFGGACSGSSRARQGRVEGRWSARSGTAREVVRRAQAAVRAGCEGVVASAQEAALLRRRCGRRLRIVCPGIRPTNAPVGDQARVATPAEAIAAGADYLVVGRPITEARDPRAATLAILNEMKGVG